MNYTETISQGELIQPHEYVEASGIGEEDITHSQTVVSAASPILIRGGNQ